MVGVRALRGDADLSAWADVTAAAGGSRWSLDEMRRFVQREGYRYRLALLDARPVGAFVGGPSDLAGRAFAMIRVLPSARRRGVGTALLREGVAVARELARDRLGCETRAGDEQSLRFATRRGFEQWAREVELVRVLQGNEAAPPVPGDLEIVPLARRPDLLGSAWEVCESAYRDLPIGEQLQVTRERWLEEDVEGGRVLPDLTLVAVQAGRVVAFVGMLSNGTDPEAAENGLTAVRPELRGEGIGTLLKGVQASRAAAAGYRRLVTFTQEGNDAMRRVNERLGYVEQPAWVKLVAAVGDVERALAR